MASVQCRADIWSLYPMSPCLFLKSSTASTLQKTSETEPNIPTQSSVLTCFRGSECTNFMRNSLEISLKEHLSTKSQTVGFESVEEWKAQSDRSHWLVIFDTNTNFFENLLIHHIDTHKLGLKVPSPYEA